ncbi:MAG: hypothetical protein ABIH00_02470 [Armatimonadota bacterium]
MKKTENILSEKTIIILFILFITILIVQCYLLTVFTPLDMDDSHYLYIGKLISRGFIPYKDFICVHPPASMGIAGIFFRLGFDVTGVQVLFAFINLLILFLVYFLSKKFTEDKYLPLFAVLLLTVSTGYFTYAIRTVSLRHLAVVFILWAVIQFFNKKYFRSGIIFALAGLTIFLSYPVIILFLIVFSVFFPKNIKDYLKTFTGFISLTLLFFFIFSFVPGFWDSIITFQMSMISKLYVSKTSVLKTCFKINYIPFIFFIIGFITIFIKKQKKELLAFSVWGIAVFLSFFLLGGRTSVQNFHLLIPVFCITGGASFSLVKNKNLKLIFLILLTISSLTYHITLGLKPEITSEGHYIMDISLCKTLASVPQPIQTGRSPMIALKSGIELPVWYYGTDFYYFEHSDSWKTPGNWDQMLKNTKSILYQNGFFKFMPQKVKEEIARDFMPVKTENTLIFIKK